MDFGYFGFNVGPLNNADSIERVVVAAEQLGYESIWTGEHIILMDPHEPPSPVPPESNFVDSIASLAFAAAKTERIKIGSSLLVLPPPNPLHVAEEFSNLDHLSKGRFELGVGRSGGAGGYRGFNMDYSESQLDLRSVLR